MTQTRRRTYTSTHTHSHTGKTVDGSMVENMPWAFQRDKTLLLRILLLNWVHFNYLNVGCESFLSLKTL